MPDGDVALLTGGGDRPYAFGLATALMSKGVRLDIVGSDDLDSPEFRNTAQVRFLNLRRNQRRDAGAAAKVLRVLAYYGRLVAYALTAKPTIFHLLWNNKFEALDRTLLMLYYRILGKKVALTVHNVNARQRDRSDTSFNRWTLRVQYRLAAHLFVHTDTMKQQIVDEFGLREAAVTVIPFGINNAVPTTTLTAADARKRLGIAPAAKTLLFFGKIAPYKGLEYLVDAFQRIAPSYGSCRLIIAGEPRQGAEEYWRAIHEKIDETGSSRITRRIEFVPDEETELYFKAADVLVLPYTHIFQSGVLFLGYSFGLPVIATDVGSLAEEVLEGKTGFVCKPADAGDLARAIEKFLTSDLCRGSLLQREEIQDYAQERHSWDVVSLRTIEVYEELLGTPLPGTTRPTVSQKSAG